MNWNLAPYFSERVTPFAVVVAVVIVILVLWIFSTPPAQGVTTNDEWSPVTNNPLIFDVPASPPITPTPRIEEIPCLDDTVIVPPTSSFRSRGEQICCETMTNLYGKLFTTVRPSWLKNPETNRNLELDCYNDELQIAVEYNGIQHYKYPNPFHKMEEDFVKQVRRDLMKEQMCRDQGIFLINVPYTIEPAEIPHFLEQQLQRR